HAAEAIRTPGSPSACERSADRRQPAVRRCRAGTATPTLPPADRHPTGGPMLSTMQDVPLQLRRLLEHAATIYGSTEGITALPGGLETATFAETAANTARLAHALQGLGVRDGDRVATFQWNNQQHLEAYYAAPCMGAVVHPLNIRLPADQIVYIVNAA